MFLAASSAQADDAIEAAATGNLVFESSKQIVMDKEVLRIIREKSPSFTATPHYKIIVDFYFRNTSSAPITKKIAFVLPPINCSSDQQTTAWRGISQSQDSENALMNFTLMVDGKSVPYQHRIEAIHDKNNITYLLKKNKIPLNPCSITYANNGEPVEPMNSTLKKLQLLNELNSPVWVEHDYFEWMQTFPAGKTIHIQHAYQPAAGASVPALYAEKDLNGWFSRDAHPSKPIWSRHPATFTLTNPKVVAHENGTQYCVAPGWIRYQLTTGAYWNGGIRSFELVVENPDKSPFAINQFYGSQDNMKVDIRDDKMKFNAVNFIPSHDLLIFFVQPATAPADFKFCGIT